MISIGPIVLYGILFLQSVWYYLARPRKFLNFTFYFIFFASISGLINAVIAYFLLQKSVVALRLNGIQVAYAFYYITITSCWLAGINMHHSIASGEQNKQLPRNIFRVAYVWGCIQTVITIIIFAGLYNIDAYPRLIILNTCLIWPYLVLYGYLHLKNNKLSHTGVKIMLLIFMVLNTVALIYNSVLCFTYSSIEAVLRTTYPAFFVIDFLQFITLLIANHYSENLPTISGSQMMADSGPGYVLGTTV